MKKSVTEVTSYGLDIWISIAGGAFGKCLLGSFLPPFHSVLKDSLLEVERPEREGNQTLHSKIFRGLLPPYGSTL
jgi:hypothetical protein